MKLFRHDNLVSLLDVQNEDLLHQLYVLDRDLDEPNLAESRKGPEILEEADSLTKFTTSFTINFVLN